VAPVEEPPTPTSVESWKTANASLDLSVEEDGLSTLKRGSKRSSRSSIPRSLSSRGSIKGEAAPVPDSVDDEVREDQVSVVDVGEAEEDGEGSKKKKKMSRHIPIFMRNIRKDLKEGKGKKKKGKDKFYGVEEA